MPKLNAKLGARGMGLRPSVVVGHAMSLLASTITLFLLVASSASASNIVAITMDPQGIPFLLDDRGQVWAFNKPLTFEEPIRLPNLYHITKIAPYIAVDNKGHVFTWSLNPLKTDWGPDGLNEAAYNLPQRVENLQGVTSVSSSGGYYFAAVIGNKDIVDWLELPDKSKTGALSTGPIRKVYSRSGVKGVALGWSPEVTSTENVVVRPLTTSLVALFDDGDVIGWGINASGTLQVGSDMKKGVLLAQLPGATAISRSSTHTVVLTANGVPMFWGGCDLDGRDANGQSWSSSKLAGEKGNVADVQQMAINPGNDNALPNAFLKRDGSIWLAYAPLPSGMTAQECYRSGLHGAPDKQQLPIGDAVVEQVVTRDGIVLILDSDHQLWKVDTYWMRLEHVPVNLE